MSESLKVFLLISTLILLFLQSCNLLKKTTKTVVNDTQNSSKFSDFNMLNIKTADKETNIFTYWDSGVVYQYQNIRERVDQTESVDLKTTDQLTTKKDVVIKESEPPVLWIYAGIGLLLIGALIVYWKR
ncbi:hypothetical protein [Pedobacter hiemivivus]|uniref:Uncharacterized protein n=1 Tax=Pedobacter hiemivivus TaxID=2530454 RepID=A0A4R0NF58_9SPHI|nr:hypothetical protein [Pedobacter hiemivivus]TCC97244.1 hypothetical protein EZ444_10365 [Pedobacter hiemivivus]